MDQSDIISGIAAAAALFALLRTEQTRTHLLRAGWDEIREYRGKLRPIARQTYASFVANKEGNWPENLELLLISAGLPPNVPIRKGKQIANWYEENNRGFNEDQSRLWEYAAGVYPEKTDGAANHLDSIIIDNKDRNSFDESRRHIATFFHRQWQATSNRRLFSVLSHTIEDVILLSWLELALVRATKDSGPARDGFGGKRGLFEFGRFLQKRHTR